VLEQWSALAQQHRHQVDLELAGQARPDRALSGLGAVDQDVAIAGGEPGFAEGGLDVFAVHVGRVGSPRPDTETRGR
jgi:hypothetical protein